MNPITGLAVNQEIMADTVTRIDSKAVLTQIAGEFFQNVFFYGMSAVAIVAILTYVSWWFAFILFIGFTIVVISSILHQVRDEMTVGTNVAYLPALVTAKTTGAFAEYGFLATANLIQLAEMALLIFFNLELYRGFFK